LSYQIVLPQFEGPFDLLLFFIERDELDIYDIPIHSLTKNFLGYIHSMEALNVEVASEFILVAATLMRIKSKMLLPKKEVDGAGNEIDPRLELVDRLLEYKKYKDVLDVLKTLEDDRHRRDKRGNLLVQNKILAELSTDEAELESVTLYKLVRAFQKVIDRQKQKEQNHHTVVTYPYSIESQKDWLLSLVSHKKRFSFSAVFGHCENRIHAVFSFLAMLELVQASQLSLVVGEGLNTFWLAVPVTA